MSRVPRIGALAQGLPHNRRQPEGSVQGEGQRKGSRERWREERQGWRQGTKRRKRRRARTCYNCQQPGHIAAPSDGQPTASTTTLVRACLVGPSARSRGTSDAGGRRLAHVVDAHMSPSVPTSVSSSTPSVASATPRTSEPATPPGGSEGRGTVKPERPTVNRGACGGSSATLLQGDPEVDQVDPGASPKCKAKLAMPTADRGARGGPSAMLTPREAGGGPDGDGGGVDRGAVDSPSARAAARSPRTRPAWMFAACRLGEGVVGEAGASAQEAWEVQVRCPTLAPAPISPPASGGPSLTRRLRRRRCRVERRARPQVAGTTAVSRMGEGLAGMTREKQARPRATDPSTLAPTSRRMRIRPSCSPRRDRRRVRRKMWPRAEDPEPESGLGRICKQVKARPSCRMWGCRGRALGRVRRRPSGSGGWGLRCVALFGHWPKMGVARMAKRSTPAQSTWASCRP